MVSTNTKEVCPACDGKCDCYSTELDEKKEARVLFYVLFEEDLDCLFGVEVAFIKDMERFHQIDLDGGIRHEFIEDSSTEDNIIFIGNDELIAQYIEQVNPLYQPAQADFSSHAVFEKAGGEWQDGDFVFFILMDSQGKWKISGGEYLPDKEFH